MKKDLALIAGLFLVVILLVVFGKGYTSLAPVARNNSLVSNGPPSKEVIPLKVKSLSIQARVADIASERKKGLSELDSLPLNEGMLFVFESEGQYGIWMKDMKFAIDIIWVDKNKKIIDIEQNVAPEPGKKDNELNIYKPEGSSLYILEVNAGLSSLHSLEVGDLLELEL